METKRPSEWENFFNQRLVLRCCHRRGEYRGPGSPPRDG